MTCSIKIIPLGGLGEIGCNILLYEYKGKILIVDCGVMFPENDFLGIDLITPDFEYLLERQDDIVGLLVTHGHEDHFGAIPYLLKDINIPIFASKFALTILEEKMRDRGFYACETHEIHAGEKFFLDPFDMEFFSVCHSVVDCIGLALKTPNGYIVHASDFKLDAAPPNGGITDMDAIKRFAHEGVWILLSDSTNVERKGATSPEKSLISSFETIIQSATGKLIISLFASNISRIQLILDLAEKYSKKLVFCGRSMKTYIRIAHETGFLRIPQHLVIDTNSIRNYKDTELLILASGTQGEMRAALTRISRGEFPQIKLKKGDLAVLSSRFIPGNEKAISRVINDLYRQGAKVIYEKVANIHVSGHAYQDELEHMIKTANPKCFIPIHGEYRYLVKHAQLAARCGLPEKNILVLENGQIGYIEKKSCSIAGTVPFGKVLMDSEGQGGVDDFLIRARKKMAGIGIFVIVILRNKDKGTLMREPEIISKGFIDEDKYTQTLMRDVRAVVHDKLDDSTRDRNIPINGDILKEELRIEIRRFFKRRISKKPEVLPIIIDV